MRFYLKCSPPSRQFVRQEQIAPRTKRTQRERRSVNTNVAAEGSDSLCMMIWQREMTILVQSCWISSEDYPVGNFMVRSWWEPKRSDPAHKPYRRDIRLIGDMYQLYCMLIVGLDAKDELSMADNSKLLIYLRIGNKHSYWSIVRWIRVAVNSLQVPVWA